MKVNKNLFFFYLVFLSELIPDRSKGFAVSAPRGVEFDEDVFGGVLDEFVKVLSDNDLDSVGRVVWDIFRFQMSSNRAIQDSVDKSGDSVRSEIVLYLAQN